MDHAVATALISAVSLAFGVLLKYLLDFRKVGLDAHLALIARLEERIRVLEAKGDTDAREIANLREEIGKLRELVQRFDMADVEGCVTSSEDQKIIDWDDGMVKLLHWERRHVIGRGLATIIPAAYQAEHEAQIQEVVKGTRPLRKEALFAHARTREGYLIPISIRLEEKMQSGMDATDKSQRCFVARIRMR
jgi:PAS domain-containing protein